MILCCGDALIDFLPAVTAAGAAAFQPVVGGSVHNVAIALGRMGVPSAYFSGLSNDFFGEQIAQSLTASGVSLAYAPRFARHTTLAFVRMENGHARYAFIDDASAGRLLTVADLPRLGPEIEVVHFGSIHLIQDPVAGAMEVLAARAAPTKVVTFDPNIRPTLIHDRADYLKRFNGFKAQSDIMKLSDEDLAWLAPDGHIEALAAEWLASGARLVILTAGAAGARAFAKDQHWEVPAIVTTVVDTVGAGDTFTAGVLASLRQAGALAKPALAKPDYEIVGRALQLGARAAAITCSRAGANPPWSKELA
jgi:fructokinase